MVIGLFIGRKTNKNHHFPVCVWEGGGEVMVYCFSFWLRKGELKRVMVQNFMNKTPFPLLSTWLGQ